MVPRTFFTLLAAASLAACGPEQPGGAVAPDAGSPPPDAGVTAARSRVRVPAAAGLARSPEHRALLRVAPPAGAGVASGPEHRAVLRVGAAASRAEGPGHE